MSARILSFTAAAGDDEAARRKIREDLDTTLIVEAAKPHG